MSLLFCSLKQKKKKKKGEKVFFCVAFSHNFVYWVALFFRYVNISVGNAEMFYYFIESEGNPIEDPVLLWYSGGPGCSAFNGLIYENGTISIPDAKLKNMLERVRLKMNQFGLSISYNLCGSNV
jgi:hypothetical protein